MTKRPLQIAATLAPAVIGTFFWQLVAAGSPRLRFLIGSPALVAGRFGRELLHGRLIQDSAVTGLEAISGLVLGMTIGTSVGLAIWVRPVSARVLRPYAVALGAVPIFALAPMMVLWFGTGFVAKVCMAALSTVFLAFSQAFEGARNADAELVDMVVGLGATRAQVFQTVIVPSALVWVMVSSRLNIGFALLGAFLGEIISSDRGLGHYIQRSSGLYDVPSVLCGVASIIILAFIFGGLLNVLERAVLPWRFRDRIP